MTAGNCIQCGGSEHDCRLHGPFCPNCDGMCPKCKEIKGGKKLSAEDIRWYWICRVCGGHINSAENKRCGCCKCILTPEVREKTLKALLKVM